MKELHIFVKIGSPLLLMKIKTNPYKGQNHNKMKNKHKYDLNTIMEVVLKTMTVDVMSVDLDNSTINDIRLKEYKGQIPNLKLYQSIKTQNEPDKEYHGFYMEIDINSGKIKNWSMPKKCNLIIPVTEYTLIGLMGTSVIKKLPFQRFTRFENAIPSMLKTLTPKNNKSPSKSQTPELSLSLSLSISKTGKIKNWKFDISEFLSPEEKYILDPKYIKLKSIIFDINND